MKFTNHKYLGHFLLGVVVRVYSPSALETKTGLGV